MLCDTVQNESVLENMVAHMQGGIVHCAGRVHPR